MVTLSNPVGTPTFECIGVRVDYSGTPSTTHTSITSSLGLPAAESSVIMEYREEGTVRWITAFPMYCDTVNKEFRGSLFWLKPKTTYDIMLTGSNIVTFAVTTRDDNPPSNGRSFYVSKSGNDSNDGSVSTPWATLTKASASVQAGDTVYFRAGNYAGGIINVSGVMNNYITFRNYESEKVTFNSQVYITGSYVRFRGIDASASIPNYIYYFENNNDCFLEDCHVSNLGTSSYSSCVGIYNGSQRITVQRCQLTVTGNPNGDIEDKNGIYYWKAGGNHVFRDLTINGMPWDGIGGGPEDDANTLNDSDIYRVKVTNAWDDGIQPEGGVINTRCWSNTVRSSMLGYTDACQNLQGPLYIFRSDICADKNNRGDGNNGCLGSGNGGEGRVYYFHNSFWGMEGSIGFSAKNYGVFNHMCWNNIVDTDRYAIEWGHEPDGTNCTFRKNILRHRNTNYDLIKWGNSATNYILDNLEDVDPKFTNPSQGDLSLQSGSPAINAGLILPTFNDADSPYNTDIGAIEYKGEKMVTFTGTVSAQSTPRQVTIQVNKPSGGIDTVSTTTDSNRNFSVQYNTSLVGSYSAQATASEDTQYLSSTSPIVNFTVSKQPSTITLNVV